jgi:hypothetical protein
MKTTKIELASEIGQRIEKYRDWSLDNDENIRDISYSIAEMIFEKYGKK